MDTEDDSLKRLKEEEMLLRAKAESLGIMIEFPEEEKEEIREKTKEEEIKEEEIEEEQEAKENDEKILEEEEEDRFSRFLNDVKEQRLKLEGPHEESNQLLAETDDVLELYTKEYIVRNLKEAQRQYETLSAMPLEGEDALEEERIKSNLSEFASRIKDAEELLGAVPAKKSPPKIEKEKKSPTHGRFKEFLAKTEKFLEEHPSERISENLVETEDAFGKLLEEGKDLPTQEEPELEKRIIENLESIQKAIVEAKRGRYEERGRLILKAVRRLKDSEQYIPAAYNNIALKFQNLAPDLSGELRDVIKEELALTYSKMKEMEAKRKEEEKKAQAEGIRVYWGTYLKKIDIFISEIEKARPVEIMDYYLKYKKLVAEYERMNKQEISDFETEAAQDKLDQCYELLERLRLQT